MKCEECGEEIKERYIECEGMKFHLDCFYKEMTDIGGAN